MMSQTEGERLLSCAAGWVEPSLGATCGITIVVACSNTLRKSTAWSSYVHASAAWAS